MHGRCLLSTRRRRAPGGLCEARRLGRVRPANRAACGRIASAPAAPQVRAAQLDKEAAELRDENDSLHSRLSVANEAAAGDLAGKVASPFGGPPASPGRAAAAAAASDDTVLPRVLAALLSHPGASQRGGGAGQHPVPTCLLPRRHPTQRRLLPPPPAQAETLRSELLQAQLELSGLYKEKSHVGVISPPWLAVPGLPGGRPGTAHTRNRWRVGRWLPPRGQRPCPPAPTQTSSRRRCRSGGSGGQRP